MANFCSECGAALAGARLFCSECGHQMGEAEPTASTDGIDDGREIESTLDDSREAEGAGEDGVRDPSAATFGIALAVTTAAGTMDHFLDSNGFRFIALDSEGYYTVDCAYISLARELGYEPKRWRYPSELWKYDFSDSYFDDVSEEAVVAKEFIANQLPEGITIGYVDGFEDWIYPIGHKFTGEEFRHLA